MKTCRTCGQEKPEAEFYFINRTQKLNTQCKICHGARGQAWRKANPEKRKAKDREWALANVEKTKAAQERWKAKNPGIAAERTRVWRENNLEKAAAIARKHYQDLRDQAFMAYGGYRCSCCGETERLFLSIDHINNDGAEHRRSIKKGNGKRAGLTMYAWLVRNGLPPGFQVLCMNCNMGKHRNGGVCPHKATP